MRQTVGHAVRLRAASRFGVPLSVWRAMLVIADFDDASRAGVPPIPHSFQTAETLRNAGAPDWMQLVGLVHRLGCVLAYVGGVDADGTSTAAQWSLTGETRVLIGGTTRAGLDGAIISYDQGEYLFNVLRESRGVRLPPVALRVLRYQALAAWHTRGTYADLENDEDRAARPYARQLAECARYDEPWRSVDAAGAAALRAYYGALVRRFLPKQLLW